MPKEKYNRLVFIPKSFNMSELLVSRSDDGENSTSPMEDIEDKDNEQEDITSKIFAEEVVVQILFNLQDREKVIFMFQLLRQSGYAIDYSSAAITMGIPREEYMKILALIKRKAGVIVKDAYKAR